MCHLGNIDDVAGRVSELEAASNASVAFVPDEETKVIGVYVRYDITLTNPGGYFRKHFSAEEQGIYELCIVFFATYTMVLLWYLKGMKTWEMDVLKSLVHIFTSCLFVQWMHFLSW